jgi:heptosyltransferase-2
MAADPKKILIIRTDRLGDVILSTPVIKNLRNCFPEAHIAFICRPYTKRILEGNPYLNEVIVYDKYRTHKKVWPSIKFALDLRKKKFDWALILHPTNRVHIFTFFAGIPLRIGWDKKMGWLLTKKLPQAKQEGARHELEYTLDILRTLGLKADDKTTYFPINKEAQKRVGALLKEFGLRDEEKLIVIHPSASCPSKRWPQEHFLELIKLFEEKKGFKIAVVTSEEEKSFGQKLVEDNRILDLRGKLDILELASLLQQASLFVSNDSGPVHIAANFKIPVISIFGRKDPGLSPQRWKPLGNNSSYLSNDPGCTVCLAHDCNNDFLCLKNIEPKQVAQKAFKLLKVKEVSDV